MKVQPYLNFDGRCDEAIAFYRKALGAEVTMIMRYKDAPKPDASSPCPAVDPSKANLVMHSTLQIGDSTISASDGHGEGKPSFKGIALTLTVNDEQKAQKAFAALSDGGQVQMPLTKTFFSPAFGMLADRFGVGWMILVGQ
ncbi:MAG TPA: VOC family protein [Tepidisphaeraceae bacterium]|jgi:PhnB protein|nr:VOC family protein [Tepidisphaeraceae bacterium]